MTLEQILTKMALGHTESEEWPVDWEFTVWEWIERGMQSYQLFLPAGVCRCDARIAHTLSQNTHSWSYNRSPIVLHLWKPIFEAWKNAR